MKDMLAGFVAMMACLAVVVGAYSCTHVQRATGNFINCAEAELFKTWTDILPMVDKAIRGQDADWNAELERLASTKGLDAVLCAVSRTAGQMLGGGQLTPAQVKARSFLQAKAPREPIGAR